MTKGLVRALRNNMAAQAVVKQVIKARALAISVAGTTGVGWGTAVIGDLPQGNILLLGAMAYLQFTTVDTDVQATFDGDYAIGTTPTADAVITGTDANIVPSTALGAATGGVSPVVRGAGSGGAMGTILDNTDGSLELNLNLLIDDVNISGTGDFTVSGYVVIAYSVLGDD